VVFDDDIKTAVYQPESRTVLSSPFPSSLPFRHPFAVETPNVAFFPPFLSFLRILPRTLIWDKVDHSPLASPLILGAPVQDPGFFPDPSPQMKIFGNRHGFSRCFPLACFRGGLGRHNFFPPCGPLLFIARRKKKWNFSHLKVSIVIFCFRFDCHDIPVLFPAFFFFHGKLRKSSRCCRGRDAEMISVFLPLRW